MHFSHGVELQTRSHPVFGKKTDAPSIPRHSITKHQIQLHASASVDILKIAQLLLCYAEWTFLGIQVTGWAEIFWSDYIAALPTSHVIYNDTFTCINFCQSHHLNWRVPSLYIVRGVALIAGMQYCVCHKHAAFKFGCISLLYNVQSFQWI